MTKADQTLENLVTREQKVFNQTASEPNGMVLDVECGTPSKWHWQPRFALVYNYSVNHPGSAIVAGSCEFFRGDVSFSSTEKRKKRSSTQESLVRDHAAAGA